MTRRPPISVGNAPKASRSAEMLAQAVICHQRGSLAEAHRLYTLVLAADRRNVAALENLALLETQRGNLAEALRLLDDCARVKPRTVETHINRGHVLELLGRDDEALASLERALSIDPRSLLALANRGSVLRRLGRYDEALASYDKALALNPDYLDAHYNRGNLLLQIGRAAEALASFEIALRSRPDDPAILVAHANVLMRLGRAADAVASLDRVLTRAPDHVLALVNRGHGMRALRRYPEAVISYERALARDPHQGSAWSGLAFAALAACDWDRTEKLAPLLAEQVRRGTTVLQHAHTTACDALWAGLPIVTCRGRAFAGRVAASLLTNLGLSELVADTLDDYASVALRLARTPALLGELRKRLKPEHLLRHAPFDGDRVRREIEAAYREMWGICLRGDRPRGFAVAPLE